MSVAIIDKKIYEPLVKKYIEENIQISYWKKFLNECTKEISCITKISIKRVKQKIINYFTYIRGTNDNIHYAFFPATANIKDNKKFLCESFLFDKYLPEDILTLIVQIIIERGIKYRKIISKTTFTNNNNFQLDRVHAQNIVELSIVYPPYSNKFKINLEHYERLKEMFVGNKELADFWICILLLRYEYYGSLLEGINLSVNTLYDIAKKYYDENTLLEAFAGSLNSNLKNYCSVFYDIEKYFGSKGSFFKMGDQLANYKMIISNPPYISEVMLDTAKKFIKLLESPNEISIIHVMPDWRNYKQYNLDKKIQITINEIKQKRYTVDYPEYDTLHKSCFVKYIFSIGNYEYYDFFSDSKRTIGKINTLIILLSNAKNNEHIEKIKDLLVSNK